MSGETAEKESGWTVDTAKESLERQLSTSDRIAALTALLAKPNVDLKEHMEALRAADQRALEMAAKERDNAASVLREERSAAIATAEREREKTAQALRDATASSIKEGDERLREHVNAQVAQIHAATASAELLELERIGRVRAELTAAQASADKAIIKAEAADHERFESHNGLIEQMRQQAEKSEQTALAAQAKFVQKDVLDASNSEQTRINQGVVDALASLRQDIAVGSPEVKDLTRRADQGDGGVKKSQEITALMMAMLVIGATMMASFVSVGGAIIVRLAFG